MIGKLVNKIKTGTERLDHSMSQRPWSGSGYLPGPWFIPKAMYGALKYLIYHPTRLAIKGLPHAVNLEKTWKENIRPKIPFGNPDVYFDVRENKTTNKDYGIEFDPIIKKKEHGKDVRIRVPRYKLPQRSIQQFEAWIESSEEDKKNKNFIPESSDKKKLSNNEQEAYDNLIKLYEFLKENNGTVKVEGEVLVIRISIANKTLKEIEEQVKHCYNVLGMPYDKEMIQTIAKRLYKKAQDQAISSDEPFAKTKQQQTPSESVTESPSHPALSSQGEGKDIDGEVIEDATKQQSPTNTVQQPMQSPTLQSQGKESIGMGNKHVAVDLNNIKNMEHIKQTPNVTKEEQMSDSVSNSSQFSLTNPGEFPNNIVSLQSDKGSIELQSDLISRSEIGRPDIGDIKNQVIGVAGENLRDVSLSTTGVTSSISGNNRRRSEEVSRG